MSTFNEMVTTEILRMSESGPMTNVFRNLQDPQMIAKAERRIVGRYLTTLLAGVIVIITGAVAILMIIELVFNHGSWVSAIVWTCCWYAMVQARKRIVKHVWASVSH